VQDAARVVVSGFAVSNGWLYHFKKRQKLQKKYMMRVMVLKEM
jgi:hypothetical protein